MLRIASTEGRTLACKEGTHAYKEGTHAYDDKVVCTGGILVGSTEFLLCRVFYLFVVMNKFLYNRYYL